MTAKSLAIITARGGSKRIPRKNIKNFLGKPIISYPLEAAIKANCFEEIMVSTDDQEIASIAQKLGAKVPFLRSKKTSNDFATTAEVIEEVLLEYKKNGQQFEYCCCIYPTAVFVTPEKLQKGFILLKESEADIVIPVTRFDYPIQRALSIQDNKLIMIQPQNYNKRSQDLSVAYHDSGQFYWLNTARFLKQKKIFTDNAIPMIIPESEIQDIDTEEDWKRAEWKYKVVDNL